MPFKGQSFRDRLRCSVGRVQRGFNSRCTTNTFYRFRRLKRRSPKVAADVLKGKYLRARKKGETRIDMRQAELDAGIISAARQKATSIDKAHKAISRLSAEELRALAKSLSTVEKRRLRAALGSG